MTEICRW